MIIEEASFVSENLLYDVVVPLLGVNDTAVLAISTPDDEDNAYSVLMDMCKPDSDETVFRTIKVGLFCDDCMLQKAIKCPHKRRLPDWKSEARLELTEQIMKSNPERMRRELHGMVGSKKKFLFKNYTSKFRELTPYRWRERPKVLHLAIDPSGGGGSDWSYTLVGHEDPYDVIVSSYGIETQDMNDIFNLFIALFTMLRASPIYRDALVWVYPEANSGYFNCTQLRDLFMNRPQIFGRVEFQMYEPYKNEMVPGVFTHHETKEKYANYLQHKMSNGQLLFAEEMIGNPERLESEKRKLIDQLNNYRMEMRESIHPGLIPDKCFFTGKSGGRRDDLCMALQIAIYQMQLKRDDPDFQQRCAREGWMV